MTERRPIQYCAGTLAASAFVSVTQILAGATLDLPLYITLAAFAVTIPFLVMIFLMPLPMSIGYALRLSALADAKEWPKQHKMYCLIYCVLVCFSIPVSLIGFVAIFWHFAWWLGMLFAVAASTGFWMFNYFANKTVGQTSTDHSESPH